MEAETSCLLNFYLVEVLSFFPQISRRVLHKASELDELLVCVPTLSRFRAPHLNLRSFHKREIRDATSTTRKHDNFTEFNTT